MNAEIPSTKGNTDPLDLRNLIEAIPAPAVCVLPDGAVEFVNQEWREYTGSSLEQFGERVWQTAIHPDDTVKFIDELTVGLTGGKLFQIEARLRRADGQYLWFLIRKVMALVPRHDPESSVHTLISCEEMNERAQAEAKLEQGGLLQAFFENSPNLIFVKDRQSRYIYANKQFKKAFHISGEVKGKTDNDLFSKEQAAAFQAADLQVLQTGLLKRFEDVALYADGLHTRIVQKFPLFNAEGEIYAIGGAVTDITDRKREESALRYSEEKYRLVVETASDAMLTIDQNGAIQSANPATKIVFGYDPGELVGRPLTVLMPEYLRKLHEMGFNRYMATGERHINWQGTELTGLRKDGHEFPIEVSFGELTNSGQRLFTGFIRDISKRKQAEDKLRASERDLNLIINTMPTLAGTFRPDGHCDFFNQPWRDYTGLSGEQAQGAGWAVAVHPEDSEGLLEIWRSSLVSGAPLEAEARLRRFDGAYRWCLIRGNPLRDELGTIVRWYQTTIDIDDRKRAQMALHAAIDERTRVAAFREETGIALSRQNDLKGILHSCASAMVRHLEAAFARIWTLSSDGRELELQASAGIYTRLDGSHSRIPVGHLKIGLIAQERRPHFTNEVQNDPRVSDKDWARREKIVSFAGYPLVLEDRLVGVMGMFSQKPLSEGTREALSLAADLIAQGIERKRAEEALRASERTLRELTETIPQMLWSADADGTIDYCNQRVLDYTGLSPEQVREAGWMKSVHQDDVEKMKQAWRAAVSTGEPFQYEFRGRRAVDNAYRWCITSALPLRDHERRVIKWFGTVVDMHDWREAQQALQVTQAELARVSRVTTMGELAASIAHEVNQPLTAVTNNSNACLRLLAAGNLQPEVLRRVLEEIVADGTRASTVVAQIRGFIKKTPTEKSKLDINGVIQDVLTLTDRELHENQVLLERQLAKALPLVLADRVQLQQVLLNLIMNGIEAMAAVTNRTRSLCMQSRIDESGHVLVAVRDSGTGLSSEAHRLFNPFFTTKANGMGMGLAISRSLIEGHNGRLWATPNSPHGAVFSFTLPAAGDAVS